MLEPIESTFVFRKRLGTHLEVVKGFDSLARERELTKSFRPMLITKYQEKCGYCGQSSPVETAHLVPLELGGLTFEENLILLCKICHLAFDSGAVSINQMAEIAKDWRLRKKEGEPRVTLRILPSPQSSIVDPPGSVVDTLNAVSSLQRLRKYRKAILLVDQALGKSTVCESGRLLLLIKRAELSRRRAGKGVLAQALNTLESIEPNKLPLRYWPGFYYEYGFVQRTRGYHREAADLMGRGAAAAMKIGTSDVPPLAYVPAAMNEVLCQIADTNPLTIEDVSNFDKRLDGLEHIAMSYGKYWGSRWAMNCAGRRVELRLKANDRDGGLKTMESARELYFQLDQNSGWDSGSKASFSMLEGLIRARFPRDDSDLDTGVSLLARAMVTRTGSRRRPDGVRDVGFGFVEGLRKMNLQGVENTCEVIEELLNNTMDGISLLWPWKATA